MDQISSNSLCVLMLIVQKACNY